MFVASVLCAAILFAPGAELQTLSGKKLTGDLIGLDRQTVILRTTDGEVRHPVADVLLIDLAGPASPPPKTNFFEMELIDGTVLHCSQVVLKGVQAELTMLPDVTMSIPLSAVFTILRDAQDLKTRERWQQYVAKRGQFDKVAVYSGDQFDGLEGTFGPGTGDGIEFTPSSVGSKRNVKLSNQVAGFIFAQRPDPSAPPPLCKITDAAGNLIVAAEVVLNAQGLVVTTVSGARIAFPDAKRVAKLDFSKGKLTYLSDLTGTPIAGVEPRLAPSLAGETDPFKADDAVLFRVGRDRNLVNGPLTCGGTNYPKGLSLHAGTALKYDLGADYREFRVVIGVDDSVETESRVDIVVEGDGRELYHGSTSRKDPPRPLAVDVKGVRELRVTVRAPGLFDTGSQVNLADAKVSK